MKAGKIILKTFIGIAISVIFFINTSCHTGKKVPQKTNILILMSDNQSWNHLGCYGDPVGISFVANGFPFVLFGFVAVG